MRNKRIKIVEYFEFETYIEDNVSFRFNHQMLLGILARVVKVCGDVAGPT